MYWKRNSKARWRRQLFLGENERGQNHFYWIRYRHLCAKVLAGQRSSPSTSLVRKACKHAERSEKAFDRKREAVRVSHVSKIRVQQPDHFITVGHEPYSATTRYTFLLFLFRELISLLRTLVAEKGTKLDHKMVTSFFSKDSKSHPFSDESSGLPTLNSNELSKFFIFCVADCKYLIRCLIWYILD